MRATAHRKKRRAPMMSGGHARHVAGLAVKGIGEGGDRGAPPAIVSAVSDALGVAQIDMSLLPETIWHACARPNSARPPTENECPCFKRSSSSLRKRGSRASDETWVLGFPLSRE
jgi:hypothetical protein